VSYCAQLYILFNIVFPRGLISTFTRGATLKNIHLVQIFLSSCSPNTVSSSFRDSYANVWANIFPQILHMQNCSTHTVLQISFWRTMYLEDLSRSVCLFVCLAVLAFILLCLWGRRSTTWVIAPALFAFTVFSNRFSHLCLVQPGPQISYLSFLHSWADRYSPSCPALIDWLRVLRICCLDWP
jgi:hypothetical protein